MRRHAMATIGWLARMALVVAGVVLGMAIVAGHGFWHARLQAGPPEPAASVPAGSFVAPGMQG
jgi:UPF0716 family protein affecting phage T7 exclusion